MKNTKMAMLFALALTLSLVWGINEEAQAASSCDNPRCKGKADVCMPGNSISTRESCKDDFNNILCELQLPCNTLFPPIE